MALHSLMRKLAELSLHPSKATPAKIATAYTRGLNFSYVNKAPLLEIINAENRCFLHTSNKLARNLDSHRVEPSKLPSVRTNRWVPLKSFAERFEYTVKPLPFPKTGGRGPNGRIWTHRRGGGHKRNFRMIDWVRGEGDEGKPLVEKVKKILYDPNRSGRIALVATGERKRYVLATQNMQVGDLITSSRHLSKTAIRAQEGDAHPLGSLPIGTMVNSVEVLVGQGAHVAKSAGVSATLVRKIEDKCIVRMPSKREICVSNQCVATVGRVSNVDHNKRVIGKAGRNRWLGIRPKSGRWHRKDGRFGRKIRPIKPMRVYDKQREDQPNVIRLSHYR